MHYAKMKGNEVFKVAVRMFAECAERILTRNGFTADDVSLFIPHQANLRIIEAAAEHFQIPAERYFINLDRYGNTAAASVPICLHEALAEGRIKNGDLVMLVAFGTGFSWGATLLRW
jgi:3-oxoacyl-[acyl-carrier-protein] synthase-3